MRKMPSILFVSRFSPWVFRSKQRLPYGKFSPGCCLLLLIAILVAAAPLAAETGETVMKTQAEQYRADIAKTIVELQPFRRQYTTAFNNQGKTGKAVLIDLNPTVNIWYLFRIAWDDGARKDVYHLENPYPGKQRIMLTETEPGSLVIIQDGRRHPCDLWPAEKTPVLDRAVQSGASYAPICGGRLYVRNPTKGHQTAIESVTDFLRDAVPGGESIVGFVRDTFFKDKFRKEGDLFDAPEAEIISDSPDVPAPAFIDPAYRDRRVVPTDLGISLVQAPSRGVAPGRWYPAKDNPGIYVSLIQPGAVSPEVYREFPGSLKGLDSKARSALVYLIAFDLERFDLGFTVGTVHPRVNWSSRVPASVKNDRLPGPDGFDTTAPLNVNGLLSPVNTTRTVATFTGGFKRSHGAFKYGDLAMKNFGSHYGFIENGVVLSKLQPGLSTLYVLEDGTVGMKTWDKNDDALLERMVHARQNGVAIIEYDPVAQRSKPGALVGRWGPGNWSGSKDAELRTLRAGVAIQENRGKRFLIYGYFSNAIPAAMARVFKAYGCRYAMHMDMNALEHTYLAVYRQEGENLLVQHLIEEMNVLDESADGQYVPRFIGYADNRDFFYLMRREK